MSDVVRQRLSRTKVASIQVKVDVDSDGDPIYVITVVLDKAAKTGDYQAMLGIARHLKPKLEKIHEKGFPVLSFMTKGDADKMKRELA